MSFVFEKKILFAIANADENTKILYYIKANMIYNLYNTINKCARYDIEIRIAKTYKN